MQQYTSGTYSHKPAHRSERRTIEVRPNFSTAQCRVKYNWISRKSNDKYDIYHHIQNTYCLRDFHTRRKILRMVHWGLLPINTHGTVIIYEKTNQIIYARHYCTLKLKWLRISIWMDIHGNIRVVYVLPQAGILEKNLLAQRLSNHGYYQVKKKQILWQHVWRPISFTLVVEDFGIGYLGR